MPRGSKRSQAQKQRWRKVNLDDLEINPPTQQVARLQTLPPASKLLTMDEEMPRARSLQQQHGAPLTDFRARHGTGHRHAVGRWPTSSVTGRSHKLVIPAKSPDKKLALLVGDSHLRAIVDGFVRMPDGPISFGTMSTPGASAAELRAEVLNASLPRTPEAVCLLAPSNNLTASQTIAEAASDFGQLVAAVRSRWVNVCVLDFPPRLNIDLAQQDLLRQEFHRVAAHMGVQYLSVTDHFPVHRLDLWCRDGVHLSDGAGMGILAQLFWSAVSQQLEATVPRVPAAPRSPPPAVRRVQPRVVVKGELAVPRPYNPFDWTDVGQSRKTPPPAGPQRQEVGVGECSFPLNPVWFSPAILEAMDKAVPGHLPSPVEGTALPTGRKTSTVERRARRVASKRRLEKQQVEARVSIVEESSPEPAPRSPGRVVVTEQIGASCSVKPLESISMERTSQDCVMGPVQRTQSVRASHSQADQRYGTFSQNSQCTCMALTFLAYHYEGLHFNTISLDRVLQQGDTLYIGTKQQLQLDNRFVRNHLTIEEMPKRVFTDKNIYNVCLDMSDLRVGYLKTEEGSPERMSLGLSLAAQLECLSQDVSHAFFIVAAECFAVFHDRSGHYGVFDSHSRSAEGLPDPNGTAIMQMFIDLSGMVNHLHELFKDCGPFATYEFMPVSFESDYGVTPGQSEITQRTTDVPEAQMCAEENIQQTNTDDRQPRNPASSKLCKQRRRKAMRKGTLCQNQHATQTERTNKYRTDATFQMRKKKRQREKYHTDADLQERKLNYQRKRYSADADFKGRQLNYQRKRYSTDADFKERHKGRQMSYQRKRYNTDADFKGRQLNYQRKRYSTDADFKERHKGRQMSYQRKRYSADANFKGRQLNYQRTRYSTDADFKGRQKRYMTVKYHSDQEFRLRHIRHCTQQKKDRLATDAKHHIYHKLQCAMRIKMKYFDIASRHPYTPKPLLSAAMESAISSFREKIRHGPTHVCTVCHRTLFPNQVKYCNRAKYMKNVCVGAACLTGKYVHVCNMGQCTVPCTMPRERMQEWICHTCDSHLTRGRMPPIAVSNNLALAPIPLELDELNVLERQLIAKILPFAKIVALPKGRQRAVHGAVVCVPSEVEATVNSLPRTSTQAQLLQVKLKRNIKYKGHQLFYTVNMKNVLAGLRKLKEMHPQYSDVIIDENATFESLEDDQQVDEEEPSNGQGDTENTGDTRDEQPNEDNEKEELRPGLTLDTCMQPPDIAQEVLSYGDGIFSIAPAQGNKPIGFFSVPKLEAMTFPVQFPTGQNTLDENREVKVSPSTYFNTRLFCVDTRFAKDQTYLFFAQFVTETHMANNSMSIQTKKGKCLTKDGRRISNRMLQNKEEVEKLVRNKDATRFMQPLRGTPAYWEKALRDLHAMVRQLGKPTFFLTFSAAEMRWPEFINAIKAQQGEEGDFSDLDWNAKCDILRSNPVTVMRMFEKRVEALLRDLILSPAQPIGPVEDYFYRVEFQARGSPHIHMLVWIEDAPECKDPEDCEDIIGFIDRYISCKMPDIKVDPELHKIVSEVQVHSRKHSKSCKKGNVECRFGFPKLPMDKTVLIYPDTFYEQEEAQDKESGKKDKDSKSKESKKRIEKLQRKAKEKLKPLRDLLVDENASVKDLPDMLEKCNMTYTEYRASVDDLISGFLIILKRDPNDCWINGYNPDLLRAWNGNMDIQYVLDEFSCMMYMMSYISKPEHEMTEFLNSVIRDVKKTKVNERDEMKQIMQAYAKHREVSAQESVARICSLPLKKSSRSVVFIQTDEDGLKMSLPMSRLKNMSPDEEDVWMSGLPEKYLHRPASQQFDRMCLATFASRFRILYGHQTEGPNAIPLQNNMGFIQKRTTGKPAVIRYTKFSEEKQREKFYRRLLKLYFPHRSDDELKNEQYPTYEEFYQCGTDDTLAVKTIVDFNKERYEGQGKKIEKVLEMLKEAGPVFNAWNTFAPEMEVDRLECVAQRQHISPDEKEDDDEIPDYQVCPRGHEGMPAIQVPKLSPDFVRNMNRSLNEMQASVFYTVREWCFSRIWGHNPKPFFHFVSGGAGCGKSHVIKCIYQEATKILRQLPRFRDEADMSQPAVLLTAFTGTAAFNISGKTLHSILKLPRNLKPPYQGLGNTLDEVRAALSNAEILIIDEISMVSKDLFAYVHWRFQQIKGNKKPFGGMSVLAVGDFYQLPPLGKAKPLCIYEDDVLDLWGDFRLVNLTEIMRQKDDRTFAELLNRLRTKSKTDNLNEDDKALLSKAVTKVKDCPPDALHIFATNKEVDQHNAATVTALHSTIINIPAEDYKKDPRTGQMARLPKFVKGKKRDLLDNIQAAQGARVMVIRNLDIEDGIVNGTFGTVVNIVTNSGNGLTTVKLIGLELDNPTAGQKFRKRIQGASDNLVYIERFEENTSIKGVVRRQFPMKLAFGCTAHKVQGMTMKSAVVSLKRVFEPGMAYVALSRTTSLEGLRITDFEENKIYADSEITTAMENMLHASFQSSCPLLHFVKSIDQSAPVLKIIHHNTEGLPAHIGDLKSHHEFKLADILCITETHLSGSFLSPDFQLEGYNMFARNRHVSYTNRVDIARRNGGGVAIYFSCSLQAEARQFFQNVTDLEFAVVKVEAPVRAVIATVYRPPNFNLAMFLSNMQSLLDSLEVMDCQPVVVCGDFNEDLLSKGKKSIRDMFQSRGYSQLVSAATTEKQTLIDHIYISQPEACLQSGALQTYYSYHNAVYCVLTSTV